jgi:hypothetical protein
MREMEHEEQKRRRFEQHILLLFASSCDPNEGV